MALVLADRVQETTATTGTGSITLGGAVTGYQSFAVVGNGNTCYYAIVNNSAWEVGIGTYSTTGPTLARTTVLSNSSGNTSPITLSGSSSVFLTYPAEKSVNLDAAGVMVVGSPISYSDTDIIATFASTVAGYNQVVIQNKSTATNASANLNISNDASTSTTGFAELGINSSTFSNGSGAFNIPGAAYLASASTDLSIGTYGAYNIHFATDSSTTDSMTIFNDGGISLGGYPNPGIGNISANKFVPGYSEVTSASGTTVFTAAANYYQRLVGTANQTFQLPDATTLVEGTTFVFDNDSTGTLTIKDGATTTIDSIPSTGVDYIYLIDNSTVAGTWIAYSFNPSNYDFTSGSASFGGATISNAIWNGTAVAGGYGGTGLTSFGGANNALYSTGSTTLTAGTLPVAAGGTGLTTLTAGYIPYGNGTSAYSSSASLQFNGTYLVVGGTTPLSGATNPIAAFSSTANNYVQTYTYNANTGTSASSDFVAYANNSTDAHGWADLGFTSSTYADPVYTVTGPNEAYVFGSALNSSYTGNLVYATDSTGSANAHQWYVGGFTQAKNAWKMQLNSTGLQATAIDNTPIGSTTAAAGTFTSLSDSGNLTFTGTGNRITGDMSNATVANAVHFQSSTTNGATRVGAIPNGTSTTSSFRVNNNADLANTATGAMVIDSGSFYFATSNSGTGSILPINFYTGGTQQQFAISHTGNTANYLQVTGAATTANPVLSAQGSDTNISITLTPKGTGNIVAGAGSFSGSGASLTSLNASNLASGTVPTARLASGTASASTYLRGDQTWATISAGAPGGSTTQVQYNSAGSFAGSANLTFDGTNLTCGGTVTANSDETLKTNWRDLPADFVEQLAKVKRGTYDRVDMELTQDGVSAQSLQSLLPNSVLKGEDGKLSVAYGNAALVAAIALAERVVQLEARLAALEK